jgi:hypothetical protein
MAGVVAVLGCTGEGASNETEGKPPPVPVTTTATTTTTNGSTGATDSTTAGSTDCRMGGCAEGFCGAPIDIGQTMEPEGAAFVCRERCIPTGAANIWCGGDESCCDAAATCTADGLCTLPVEPTTGGGSTGGGSTGGGSTGGGSTGGGSTGGGSTGGGSTGGGSTGGT